MMPNHLEEVISDIAFPNHIRYIRASSSLAGRSLGVGFFYLTRAENPYTIDSNNSIQHKPLLISIWRGFCSLNDLVALTKLTVSIV
jgi:hypothetical protein